MVERPCFLRHFEVVDLGTSILLIGADRRRTLSDPLIVQVARLIDGSRTADEIAELLTPEPLAHVFYALESLLSQKLLCEAEDVPDNEAAFWHSLGQPDAGSAIQRAHNVLVEVIAFGPTAHSVAKLLNESFIVAQDCGDIAVVIVDDYLNTDLGKLNRKFLDKKRPWLLVRPTAPVMWIGPLFQHGPNEGCWQCLVNRLKANRELENFVEQIAKVPRKPIAGATHVSSKFAAALTELWIQRWAGGAFSALREKIVSYDFEHNAFTEHKVARQMQCVCCGDPVLAADLLSAPITLTSKPIRSKEGGLRHIPLTEALANMSEHVSHITGVVTKLVCTSPECEPLIHTYFSDHSFPGENHSWEVFRRSMKRKSSGKGSSDRAAQASAIAEAIERYSGIQQGYEHVTNGTFNELADRALDPRILLGYSSRQYADRAQWNTRGGFSDFVPEPFDPNEIINWSPAWSLSSSRKVLAPTAYCYYGAGFNGTTPFCRADSNGCASGSCIEEAVLQGFFEVVERDSIALWWYNRVRRPQVDVDKMGDEYVSSMKALYTRRKRTFTILDVTTDLGIPTYAAVSARTDRPVQDIALGFGTHFDPRIAVIRAVTEMNQFLISLLDEGADGTCAYRFADAGAINWWQNATLENQPYLIPLDGEVSSLDSYKSTFHDLSDAVAKCISIAAMSGLEVFVVNQTRPDVGLYVVRVIVPGLRHFWARFAPGRLYDVPVKLGWRETALEESELNPTSIFF